MEHQKMILKSDRFKTIYLVTPKCGSTSIYKAILNWHGFELDSAPRIYLRHNRNEIAETGLFEEDVQLEDLESYFHSHRNFIWFSTIRHPFSRIQSAYRNKLNRYARRFDYKSYLLAKCRHYLSSPKSWNDMNRISSCIGNRIDFTQFIDGLMTNGLDWDPHYMSLAKLLRLDVVTYDCLLRLESLSTDYQQLLDIMEKRGVRTEEFEGVSNLNASSSGISTNLVLKHSLQSKVAELYEEDFKLLGYENSLVCS
jgi:hypothetical protein